ncbi:MAG: hypothetical protein R3F61_02590 [Myxococcota bacterium]
MVIETGLKPVATQKSTSTPMWNPLSQILPTTALSSARFDVQVTGDRDCEICPAVEFSNDGVTWDTPEEVDWKGSLPNYIDGSTEWNYGDGFVDLSSVAGTTYRRFCRFGALAKNATGAAAGPQNAVVNLRIRPKSLATQTLAPPPQLVSSISSAVDVTFVPATGALKAGNYQAMRATWRLLSTTGLVRVQGGLQTSDDGLSWNSAVRIRAADSWTSTAGAWDYGTAFEAPVFLGTAELVRFGFLVSNVSGAACEMGYARLVVEGRST